MSFPRKRESIFKVEQDMPKIGELLVQKGLIKPDQLALALNESKRSGEIIGKILVRMKLVTEAQLLKILAEQLGLIFYPSLQDMAVSEEVIKAVPAKFVWYYKFLPLDIKGKVLTIAVSDPFAVWPMEDLKLHLGYEVVRGLATEEEILSALRIYYGVGAETVEEILLQSEPAAASDTPKPSSKGDIENLESFAQDASVVKLVNQILAEAVTSRATDIHLESYRDRVLVRYRIDGILYEVRLPHQVKELYAAIVSRIKIISNLNVVERRMPQDGRAIIKVHDKQVDLRISVIPALHGENVVIRILPMNILFDLDGLGMRPEDLKNLELLLKKPHGIVFITGPTGSGKTTTLYACLSKLNKEGTKIITIEDPIEYELNGVMQIQVRPEIGFTFANALRSILRHDPDIMMVGEVRDLETAELAIRTSLTGHLIFSTLHTNDSCSGVTRLIDIGIEPYLVASSVNAFISQRLVRVICPNCKQEIKDKDLLPKWIRDTRTYYGKGCDNCKSSGYRGRVAIYEMLFINEAIRELMADKVTVRQIKAKAKETGFKTLFDAGIEKIKEGVTTVEEILRVAEQEPE
jgi:type II secretory ATPase GspE/PulE/Tfp pilus assembly ATPase PilB-like protein